MPDLRTRTLAELDRREQVTHQADERYPAPWRYNQRHKRIKDDDGANIDSAGATLGAYMTLHDPADALRRYAHYRRILERHQPVERSAVPLGMRPYCAGCGHTPTDEQPDCPDVTDLADALGITSEETADA